MTGRANVISLSVNSAKRPISPLPNHKQTRKRTQHTVSSTSGKDKSPGQHSLDLKEVLDSARRSFENDMRCNSSSRKRPISGLNCSISSRVTTRSSIINLSSTMSDLNSTLSPSKQSPKKSSSAPASPTKPCKYSPDANAAKTLNKRLKVEESNKSAIKTRITRSELLLIKAEDAHQGEMSILDIQENYKAQASDDNIKLALPINSDKKLSPKYSNSLNSSIASSITQKDPPPHLSAECKLSLCSVLDSTLDSSFETNSVSTNVSANANSAISSPKILGSAQVLKSPNRMLLSDSKRTYNSGINKNKAIVNKNNVSMNEVIKLHQDEGVMHLLHGLPSSRRARQPAGAVSATVVRRRASNEFSQSAMLKQAQSTQGKDSGNESEKNKDPTSFGTIPGLVRKSIAAGYAPTQHRPKPRQFCPNSNSLYCPLSHIKPCKKEELMTTENLEILNKLPQNTYLRLWSSPSRYALKDQQKHFNFDTSTHSPIEHGELENKLPFGQDSNTSILKNKSGNVTEISTNICDTNAFVRNNLSSIDLNAPFQSNGEYKLGAKLTGTQKCHQNLPSEGTETPRFERKVILITKHFKDILIRSYPNFVQIIIAPVTTGLRHTINANVCDELIDIMKQLVPLEDCKAILITGIGQTFCQGVDLSILTYDAPEKQRKSAETLANSVKRLIKFLLTYPKVLVAAVNGYAKGFGVTVLPYFDIVYASDKATFSLETYAKLGQIPEAFASHVFPLSNRAVFNEMLLLGKPITATEAKEFGLVSTVIWPDRFLENIVPRMEKFENMPSEGLKIVHSYGKQRLASSILEEETRELIKNWTSTYFAKKVRQYIKLNNLSFQ